LVRLLVYFVMRIFSY